MLKRFAALLLLLPSLAFAETFVAGTDYQVITSPTAVASGKTATVTEFFSYGCPWCFKLEAPLEAWVKQQGSKIHFERIPVVFHKEWELYAQAFYIAQTVGQADKLSPILFKTIQIDKKPLNTSTSMTEFLVSQGLDKTLVESAFAHSPTIELLVKNGMVTMAKYQINGVPAFVVNGRYKTDLEMAKSPERLLQILDHLISLG